MKNINTIKATLCIAAATLMSTFYGCGGTARQNGNQPVNVAVVNASNANSVCLDIVQTVSMNPEAVAIFFNIQIAVTA